MPFASRRRPALPALLALLACLALPGAARAATQFTVTDAGDAGDASIGDGTCATAGTVCTLRAALEEMGHPANTAPYAIGFAAALNGSTIQTATGFTVTRPVTIDAGNCGDSTTPKPCIGIRGTAAVPLLSVNADDVSLRGLALSDTTQEGIFAPPALADGLKLRNNWFGLRMDGSAGTLGRAVELRATGADVGGVQSADRNVFAANNVALVIRGGSDNVVRGNWLGMDWDGTAPPAINQQNIQVFRNGATVPTGNLIGERVSAAAQATPACDGGCNVIVRADRGIDLDGGDGPAGTTTIRGNHIGLEPNGTSSAPNTAGIDAGGADDVTIGGPDPGDRNTLGGGGVWGILQEDGGDDMLVEGNYVGLSSDGNQARPHANSGLLTRGSVANPTVVRGNRFVGAPSTGSALELGGLGAEFTGNVLGVASNGANLPMGGAVRVTGNANVIGGDEPAERNVIGNATLVHAIYIDGGDANVVKGNLIGVDAGGVPRPNKGGVLIRNFGAFSAADNVVGGDAPGEANVISNSEQDAVLTYGATGTRVLRNTGAANGGQFIDVGLGMVSFAGDGPGNATADNGGAQAPTIIVATTLEASGTAPAGSTVRVFSTDSPDGLDPGALGDFLGQAVANGSGNWTLNYPAPLPNDTRVTASATGTGPTGTGELAPVETSLDATPAVATIDSGPEGLINDPTPTFTFSSEPGATFKCSMGFGVLEPCTSPYTAPSLPEGQFTFNVAAIDSLGNEDPTPTTRTVRIDTSAPETTIQGVGAVIRDTTPSFTFAASEPGARFECRVDDADWIACEPGFTPRPLGDGVHTIDARASDALGNADPSPARLGFRVDTAAPALRIGRRRLAVSARRVFRVKLICPASEVAGRCRGRVTATGPRVRVKGRLRVLPLGTARFDMPAGASRVLSLRMRRTSFAELIERGRLRSVLKVRVSDPLGNAATLRRTLRLHYTF